MQKVNKNSPFFPDYTAQSLREIDGVALQQAGILYVVFDLDETLLPRKTNTVSPQFMQHIKSMQKQGLKVYIGSNTRRDISKIAKKIGCQTIQATIVSFKPRKHFYQRLLQTIGAKPENVVMIGDRILNDIVAANRAGITTVLVKPLARPKHRMYDWCISKI